MTAQARVRVGLAGGGYDVVVAGDVLPRLGLMLRGVGRFERAHLFEDAGVPAGLRDQAAESLGEQGVWVSRSVYRLDESHKSLATLERMLVDLARAGLERSDVVVAIGGGIVGDVAGLAAALHRRGVPVVQCPTTLLAMVDAAVGGKTAVNLRLPAEPGSGSGAAGSSGAGSVLLKNAVGAFHQPAMVLADVEALDSLPGRALRSGLAECIKHAVIAGGVHPHRAWVEPQRSSEHWPLHLESLVAAMPRLLAGDRSERIELVAANVSLKAHVVGQDEHERAQGDTPGRRALNLGHTFAHAVESCAWPKVRVDGRAVHPSHGEAVGLGLIASARLAERLGMGQRATTQAIERAVACAGLPTRLCQPSPPHASPGRGRGSGEAPVPMAGDQVGLADAVGQLMAAMRHDKKAHGGRLRLVVPTDQGVAMVDQPEASVLAEVWASLFEPAEEASDRARTPAGPSSA